MGHDRVHAMVATDHTVVTSSGGCWFGLDSASGAYQWKIMTESILVLAHVSNSTVLNTWVNMAAAPTELFGGTAHRWYYDLTFSTSARLTANVITAGTARATFHMQASTDGGSNWVFLGAGTSVVCSVGAIATATSPWTAIAAGLNQEVLLRVIGSGGDGAIDPKFGNVIAQFR